MKKILFVSQRDYYPFHIGGAGISIHTLLKYLASRGHECKSLCVLGQNLTNIEKYIADFKNNSVPYKFVSENVKIDNNIIPIESSLSFNLGYEIKLTLLYNFAKFFIREASAFKPDFIITQMMSSGMAVRFSFENNIPCVHLIRDVNSLYNFEPFYLEEKYRDYPCIYSNSKFVQRELFRKHKINSQVLYPSINTEDYELSDQKPKYTTFINPHGQKGLEIFIKITEKMPNHKFLVVEGWDKIDKHSPLKKIKNVTLVESQTDMRKVYKQTKILIVPSIRPEAFGRVVTEAQTSGIPIIAARHSGLLESVGKGGILVNDYLNVNSWVNNLNKLDSNNKEYQALSEKAFKNAEKFDVSTTTKDFCNKFQL